MQQLLELTELPLEAHVWEDNRPSLAGKLECFLEHHVFLLHEVCDDATCATAHASVAMNEDSTTLSEGIVDETMASRKMLPKVSCWTVKLSDPFISQLLREFRVEA